MRQRPIFPLQPQCHGCLSAVSRRTKRTVLFLLAASVVLLTPAPVAAQSATNVPVFSFAIFYNSLLEFTWGANLTVNGRTHANGDIYYGSVAGYDLTFNDTVTLTGWLGQTNWYGHPVSEFNNHTYLNGTPGYRINPTAIQLPIGTSNTPAALREIIKMPPSGELADSAMGQQRYFNKATVVLLVSNANVTLTLRSSDSPATNIAVDYLPSPTNYWGYTNLNAKFPFLTLTNSFTDLRENDTVRVTDIDIAKLRTWLRTNSACDAKFPNSGDVYTSTGAVPNIMYVADCRTLSLGLLNAVRLKNGAIIPTNNVNCGAGVTTPTGFTVATVNPLYVWGHYNCPHPGDLGTTNTASTFPASLVCDALTFLSANWMDSRSALAIGSSSSGNPKRAVSTTVNAAILAGVVYSTGPTSTNYSGGVMNLPRLLEDWGNNSSSIVLTLNTSLVNLYDSAQATAQFVTPGTYCYFPRRQFTFVSFLDYRKLPPGTPVATVFSPGITVQPQSQSAWSGSSVMFGVTASGTEPLSYQWQFNGTNVPWGTDSSLTLSNVQSSDVGNYTVVVTNAYGSVTSAPATLTLLAPPQIDSPLWQADNTFQFSVTGGSGLGWVVLGSTDLFNWVSLVTNTSPFTFTDPAATNFSQRFYRAIWAP